MSESLAWAAGFFDGEGSVGRYAAGRNAHKEGANKYPKVSVNNTDLSLLIKFLECVGIGKLYGPTTYAKKPTWKPRYWYALDGDVRVTQLYNLLRPWLGEQKTKAFESALLYPNLVEESVSNTDE